MSLTVGITTNQSKRMRRFRLFIFAAATLAVASQISALGRKTDQFSEGPLEMPAYQKLGYAERIIESFYVDSVKPDELVEEAIVSMLHTLDPHSTYSDPEETKELTSPLDGNFSGIGVQFQMIKDTLQVIQTTAGGPSEKVGILPGDRILQAGDSLISGVKSPNSRILKILRGPKGSEVILKVLRRGVNTPLTFHIVRDDIPIYSVDASYMADPTTGYIRISRFAESTPDEFDKAFRALRKQGMQNLILDLEDNGGGYLGAAHELSSRFLEKGDTVVYTYSPKMGAAYYDVKRDGNFPEGRVVVLTNQYSASAAEITAGAVQDNDRGLVVGRRTFGKGLVQRPFPFPDGSMIRLTVSKYFTPSGRCIQKPYTKGDEEAYRMDMKHRYDAGEFSSADSVHLDKTDIYYTKRNRRPVYGGGGIMPDVFVPIDTTMYSDYYRDLVAKGIINRYAATYVDDNRDRLHKEYPSEEAFIKNFEVTPEMLRGIVEAGTADSVKYDDAQFTTSRPMMSTVIKGLIGRDLFEQATYFKIANPVLNPVFREALALINDPERYAAILAGNTEEKQ